MTSLVDHSLASLFPDADRSGRLLTSWERGDHIVEHEVASPLEELVAQRYPTLKAFARSFPDLPASVYGFAERLADEKGAAPALHTYPSTTVDEAIALYDAGRTVVCWHALDCLPEAAARARGVLADLGFPNAPMAARGLGNPWNKGSLVVVSLVYTPPNCQSGLGIHFDHFDTVVVHLRGSKTWRIGKHPLLRFPLVNEEVAVKLGYPPSLPRIATRTDLVSNLLEVAMKSGSVLLLPRGNYHTTEVGAEASLSIGYHFTLPTWADVMIAGLERRLTRRSDMRRTAFGLFGPGTPVSETMERFDEAISMVETELENGEALLDGLRSDLASYQQAIFVRSEHARALLEVGPPPRVARVGESAVQLEMPAEAESLCRWVLFQHDPFSIGDALDVINNSMGALEVWQILQDLVEVGVLAKRWSPDPD